MATDRPRPSPSTPGERIRLGTGIESLFELWDLIADARAAGKKWDWRTGYR